jgi:ubiquinone/menaquinone biosynthesis C-methylase UbiE
VAAVLHGTVVVVRNDDAMTGHQGGDPIYVMGRSADETRRLQERARFFEPLTRHLFQDAGIGRGMRVLDIGSGPGDVSFLAADLVGPTGSVVGVDANPEVVRTATDRAEASGLVHVSFMAGDVRDLAFDREFDAVVGRLMLMYSADPAATLRSALRFVRPGGLAVFHEMNIGGPVWSDPVSPLHELLGRCVSEAFARSGVEMAMGTRLYDVYVAAGVAPPEMSTDAIIGAGEQWVRRFASAFGAGILRSILPVILEHGIATESELDLDTFDDRYISEVVRQRSVVQWIPFVGAWGRKEAEHALDVQA